MSSDSASCMPPRRALAIANGKAAVWVLLAAACCLAPALGIRTQAAQPEAASALREKLVLANRILAMEGLIGPFGHVSVRVGPTTFLIAKDEDHAGAWVEAGDLLELDTSLTTADVRTRGLYSEVFIHSSAYQARADLNAVVHTHSPAAIALGTLAVPDDRVLPTTNPGANLGEFIPIFRSVGLVQTPERGREVVDALLGQNGVLLRGHGAVTVGATVEQAVLRAIYLELEARTQLAARAAGVPTFYQAGESDLFKGTTAIDHPWHYYVAKLERQPAQ
jgi:ribulose-5-phosphate 4-epimerase/fuculose-1-phosphate aldolase